MSQLTSHVLMVRPASFGYNPETAQTNHFQSQPGISSEAVKEAAKEEFDALVNQLKSAGIKVTVLEDQPDPVKPDAVFPNNWISFHPDGRIFTFPMQAVNRRRERSWAIIESLRRYLEPQSVEELQHWEKEEKYLEGTGSMVLDHENKIIYACISSRTHPDPLQDFANRVGYTPVAFHAENTQEQEIYHTNVLMSVGEGIAVLCMEAITDPKERERVVNQLQSTGHEIVEISQEQMNQFAGNLLQLKNEEGKKVIVMSEQAYNSFLPEQINTLEAHGTLVSSPLETIECNGGSARCMIAEIHF